MSKTYFLSFANDNTITTFKNNIEKLIPTLEKKVKLLLNEPKEIK